MADIIPTRITSTRGELKTFVFPYPSGVTSLTGATVEFASATVAGQLPVLQKDSDDFPADVTWSNAAQLISVVVTVAESTAISAATFDYDLRRTDAGHQAVLAYGTWRLRQNVGLGGDAITPAPSAVEAVAEALALPYALPTDVESDGTTNDTAALQAALNASGQEDIPLLAPFTTYAAREVRLPPGPTIIHKPLLFRYDEMALSGAGPTPTASQLIARGFDGPMIVGSPADRLQDTVTTAAGVATGSGAALRVQGYPTQVPWLDFAQTQAVDLSGYANCGFRCYYKRTVDHSFGYDPIISMGRYFGLNPYGYGLGNFPSVHPYGLIENPDFQGMIVFWNSVQYNVPTCQLATNTWYYIELGIAAGTLYFWYGIPGQAATNGLTQAGVSQLSAAECRASRCYLGMMDGLNFPHVGGYIQSAQWFINDTHASGFTCPTAQFAEGSGKSRLLLNCTTADLNEPPFVKAHSEVLNATSYLYVRDETNQAYITYPRVSNLRLYGENNASGMLFDNCLNWQVDNVNAIVWDYLTQCGAGSYQGKCVSPKGTFLHAGFLVEGTGQEILIEHPLFVSAGTPFWFGINCGGRVIGGGVAPSAPYLFGVYCACDAVTFESFQWDDEGQAPGGRWVIIADRTRNNLGVARFDRCQLITTISARELFTCVGGGWVDAPGCSLAVPADCPAVVAYYDAPDAAGTMIPAPILATNVVPLTDHPEWLIAPGLARIAATAASPRTLRAVESGATFCTLNGTSQMVYALPTAAAGLEYEFEVRHSSGLRVNASTGDTIRNGATVTGAAGNLQCTVVGAVLKLQARDADQWRVVALGGASPSDLTMSA